MDETNLIRRDSISEDFLATNKCREVHILIGPGDWCLNTMYASPVRRGKPMSDLLNKRQGDKFCSERLPLDATYEHTKECSEKGIDVWFEFAEPIVLKNCPFCGHHATFDEISHGQSWGSWVKTVSCSSSHCRASMQLPSTHESIEECLAGKWNRRAR